jgi:hypothetical protein
LTTDAPRSWHAASVFFDIHPKIEKALEADINNNSRWDVLDSWEVGKIDLDMAKNFTNFMHGFVGNAPLVLSKLVNFKETFGIQSIIDIAGGSGCYR